MTPAKAVDAPWEELPLEACEERISGEFVYLYPPGIPIIAPGEKIKREMLQQIFYYKKLDFRFRAWRIKRRIFCASVQSRRR